MKGLFLKDLYATAALKKTYLLFIAMVFGFAFFLDFDPAAVASMNAMYLIMISVTTCFNYDEAYKWDAYGIALPVSRRQIVGARYLFGISSAVLATVISLIMSAIVSLVRNTGESWLLSTFSATFIILVLSMVIFSVIYPIAFRFGAEKSRYAMVLFTLVPFFGVLLLKDYLKDSLNIFFALFTSENMPMIVVIGTAASIAFFIGSFFLSVKIYKKREF